MLITYSECAVLVLDIMHAMCKPHILCVFFSDLTYTTLSDIRPHVRKQY
jgi:hypothetical protein